MSQRTASRVIGGATLGWLACFTYLTLTPEIPDIPGLAARDRVLGAGHLLASLVLAALVYLWLVTAHPRLPTARAAVIAFGAAAAFGLAVELVQFPVPDREPQLSDAVLDVVGSALGVAALCAIPRPTLRRPRVPVAAGAVGVVLMASTVAAAIWGTTETDAEIRCPGDVSGDELPAADSPATRGGATGRVTDGLIEEFTFDDDGDPADGDLVARGDVEQLDPGGVRFAGSRAVLTTAGAAPEVVDAIDDAFTLEAWVRPQRLTQSGPARIVSSSDGVALDEVNLHLGQDRQCLSVRVDAGGAEADWVLVEDVFAEPRPAWHVAVTYDRGDLETYVDGELVSTERLSDADLSGWSPDYPLLVGNEATRDRPFLGDVYLVAVYDRALSTDEVEQNHAAGL